MIINTKLGVVAMVVLAVTGCGRSEKSTYGDAPNLVSWVQSEKKKPGADLEPMPTIHQGEEFQYAAQNLRSPFVPAPPDPSSTSSVRPDSNRSKELLEQYSLDSFKMVGTIGRGANLVGLVQAPDKVVYRVKNGNYLGQSDGRIVSITETGIQVVEIVSNGAGGWEEKPAAINLDGQ